MDMENLLEEGKEVVALRVAPIQPYSTCCEILVDIVYVKPGKGLWNESMGIYDNYPTDKHQFKNVTLSALILNADNTKGRADIDIRISSSDIKLSLDDISTYNKSLSSIQRKFNKLIEKEGYTQTFGEDCARFAKAVGAKAFYFLPDGNRSYMRNDSIGELRMYVDSLIQGHFAKAA